MSIMQHWGKVVGGVRKCLNPSLALFSYSSTEEKKVAGHGLRLLVNGTFHNFIFSVNEVPFLYVISLTALEWTFLLNCV